MLFKFASNSFQVHFKFILNPLQFRFLSDLFYKFVTFIIFRLFQSHFKSQQINSLQNDGKFGDVLLSDIKYLCVRVWTTISGKASQRLSNFEVKNSIFSQQPQHEMKIKCINIKKPLVLGNGMERAIMVRSVACSFG